MFIVSLFGQGFDSPHLHSEVLRSMLVRSLGGAWFRQGKKYRRELPERRLPQAEQKQLNDNNYMSFATSYALAA